MAILSGRSQLAISGGRRACSLHYISRITITMAAGIRNQEAKAMSVSRQPIFDSRCAWAMCWALIERSHLGHADGLSGDCFITQAEKDHAGIGCSSKVDRGARTPAWWSCRQVVFCLHPYAALLLGLSLSKPDAHDWFPRPTTSVPAVLGECSSDWARQVVPSRSRSSPSSCFGAASGHHRPACFGRCQPPRPGVDREGP